MLAIVALAFAAGCGGPVWYLDPNFGERLAREQNRPLLMYFKVWDSSQHRNLRMKVLDHPAVKAELRGTVDVEIPWGYFPALDRKYRVPAGQVCVMCTPDGREVGRIFVNPVPEVDKFLEWLREVKPQATPTPTTATASNVP
jgi:hypothetical protein